MSKETIADAGERFADDLRRIREDRGVGIDQIHEQTRVANALIETFERGDLYDHPGFNRVYLRSFIRAYASSIGIDADRALTGLDAALAGVYEGDLAARYLDGEALPSASTQPPEEQNASAGDQTGDATAEEEGSDETGASDASSAPSGGSHRSSVASDLGRPMGGRAAAGRDLSSVSAPTPIGNGSASDARNQSSPEAASTDESHSPSSASDESLSDESLSEETPADAASEEASKEDSEETSETPTEETASKATSKETSEAASEETADGDAVGSSHPGEASPDDHDVPDDPSTEADAPSVEAAGPAPAEGSSTDRSTDRSGPFASDAESDSDPADAMSSPAGADGDDPGGDDVETDDAVQHPLLRDPDSLQTDDPAPDRPPDLQPHEDPSSDIGPHADEAAEGDLPDWMGGAEARSPGSSNGTDAGDSAAGSQTASGETVPASGRRGGGDGPHTVSAGTIDDTAPLPEREAPSLPKRPGVLLTLLRQQTTAVAAAAAAVVGAVVLVLWGLGVFSGSADAGGSSAGGTAATAGAPPSAQADPDPGSSSASSTPARPPADLTLGDTLHLTVIAEQDVSGIRIQRDDDLRRPYWIEANEASVFPFQRRVILTDPPETVDRVLVEGYPYPLDRTDAQDRIVIDRDTVAAFADTLRGPPADLPAEADTVEIPATSSSPRGASE